MIGIERQYKSEFSPKKKKIIMMVNSKKNKNKNKNEKCII